MKIFKIIVILLMTLSYFNSLASAENSSPSKQEELNKALEMMKESGMNDEQLKQLEGMLKGGMQQVENDEQKKKEAKTKEFEDKYGSNPNATVVIDNDAYDLKVTMCGEDPNDAYGMFIIVAEESPFKKNAALHIHNDGSSVAARNGISFQTKDINIGGLQDINRIRQYGNGLEVKDGHFSWEGTLKGTLNESEKDFDIKISLSCEGLN